jgi:hypothetical protein
VPVIVEHCLNLQYLDLGGLNGEEGEKELFVGSIKSKFDEVGFDEVGEIQGE